MTKIIRCDQKQKAKQTTNHCYHCVELRQKKMRPFRFGFGVNHRWMRSHMFSFNRLNSGYVCAPLGGFFPVIFGFFHCVEFFCVCFVSFHFISALNRLIFSSFNCSHSFVVVMISHFERQLSICRFSSFQIVQKPKWSGEEQIENCNTITHTQRTCRANQIIECAICSSFQKKPKFHAIKFVNLLMPMNWHFVCRYFVVEQHNFIIKMHKNFDKKHTLTPDTRINTELQTHTHARKEARKLPKNRRHWHTKFRISLQLLWCVDIIRLFAFILVFGHFRIYCTRARESLKTLGRK